MFTEFHYEKGVLWWLCPCGARVEEKDPTRSLGTACSDYGYGGQHECEACGREFFVNVSGCMDWLPCGEGHLDVAPCRKCEGDELYCHTCGEIESACECRFQDSAMGVCDHCEGWSRPTPPAPEQGAKEGS